MSQKAEQSLQVELVGGPLCGKRVEWPAVMMFTPATISVAFFNFACAFNDYSCAYALEPGCAAAFFKSMALAE